MLRASDAALDAELGAALRARGMRVTMPRLLVHRAVRRGDGHVTADDLHSQIAGRYPSLSPATVYSTLATLDRLHLVRKVGTLKGPVLWDPRREPHHHTTCERCGAVSDIEADVRWTAAVEAAESTGFAVDHVELHLRGVCEACSRA